MASFQVLFHQVTMLISFGDKDVENEFRLWLDSKRIFGDNRAGKTWIFPTEEQKRIEKWLIEHGVEKR